jgi:adenosyl cobinamide kinase/adenosyl cobinamide phosphate guanylyltransferase
MQTTTLYDQDFYAWTQRQIELLQAQQWNQVDVENLIEELDSLGKQQRQELRNCLGVLLGHLLKWRYQPEARSKSWAATILEQRRRIQRHLKENPSLQLYLPEAIEIGYEDGLDLVNRETPLDPVQLPQTCPFSEFEIFEEPVDWQ